MPWIASADQLPDSDLTVITFEPDSNEPIWLGYHDGEVWQNIEGWPCATPVTHWMEMPEPPAEENQE